MRKRAADAGLDVVADSAGFEAYHVGDPPEINRIASFIKGDTVNDVLGYVSYSHKDLIHRMRHQIEKAVESRMLTLDESALLMDQYEQGMYGYTYFED